MAKDRGWPPTLAELPDCESKPGLFEADVYYWKRKGDA